MEHTPVGAGEWGLRGDSRSAADLSGVTGVEAGKLSKKSVSSACDANKFRLQACAPTH